MGEPKTVRLSEDIEKEAESIQKSIGLLNFTATVNYCIHQAYLQNQQKEGA